MIPDLEEKNLDQLKDESKSGKKDFEHSEKNLHVIFPKEDIKFLKDMIVY